MTDSVGFIGLGLLGMPMAANLVDAGVALRVYNRTQSKADALVARGAIRAATPADAIEPGGIVVSCLWDSESVEQLVSDDFLDRLGAGVHISMTTISPEASRRLAALHAARGSQLVEAPVFGRPEAAAARKLWIPIAGPDAGKQRARPILVALGAQGIFDFGEAHGSALVVKLAGNFLIFAAAASLTEAVTVAKAQGVDARAMVEMLTTTLFNAPIYQSYGKLLADGTPQLQSKIPEKDVGLFGDAARAVDAPAPVSQFIRDLRRAK